MTARSQLDDLLRKARRRHVTNQLLTGVVFAVAVVMGGVVALLLLGTAILDWTWLAAFFLAGLAWRYIRDRRHDASEYRLAQQVDRRLNLQDTLSTALFFRNGGAGRATPAMLEAQRGIAESLCIQVDPRLAVPYRRPKSLRIAGALALAAFGLFALRYGLSRSLDLRPPIARIVFEGYFGSQSREIAALEKRAAEKRELGPNGVLSVEDQGANPAVEPEGDGSVSGSAETPGSEATTRPPSVTQESGAASDEPPANQNDGPSSGDSRDDRGDEAGSSQDPPAQPGAKRPPSSPNEDSDLINKLRDAMADLLAKLKIQPPVTESREVAAKSGASQKGRSGQPKNRQPAQGPGGRQSSEAQGSQQPGEQGESAETAESAQGQSGEQGSGQPDPRGRERSGMGKEDGSKDIKEAEQLAAMGKISEILGKRAQNLTGEVMVEVTSSQNQQLRTPYSQRRAQHADTGGEIHRDEIPLIFQHYVQRYYEEVRKSPPPAPVPAKPTAPGAGR